MKFRVKDIVEGAPSIYNIAPKPGLGSGGLQIYIGRVSDNRDFLREFCLEQWEPLSQSHLFNCCVPGAGLGPPQGLPSASVIAWE